MELMMIEILQLPIGFLIALSGVLIPGPLLAYIVLKTPSYGFRTGPFSAMGHIFVEFGILALIAFGFIFVLGSKLFQAIIGVIGGTLLLAFALYYFQKTRIVRKFPPKIVGAKHHPVIGGVLFSTVLNPSVIIWWGTIGIAALMDAFLLAALVGVIFWLIGHFLADLSWFSLVSYLVARGKRVVGTKAYRCLLITCGCVMLVFGIYFLVRYVPLLLKPIF